MLYFVQQKRGDILHLPLIVVESATFRVMRLDLKPISPKLLHKIQHSPASCAEDAENVAFFAGFARLREGAAPMRSLHVDVDSAR